jgi:uncharacterized membrane-anchored protein
MTRRAQRIALVVLAAICFGAPLAFGAKPAPESPNPEQEALPPEQAAELKKLVALEESLQKQTGKIALPGGIATLKLPESYVYLNGADTEKVLVAWGNPPGSQSLGMLYPKEVGLWGPKAWAVIVSFSEDGYVKDDEADKINYDDMMVDMKKGNAESNEERVKAGYSRLDLVGWAERPSYDRSSHKLYWAKELASEGATEHTLNYAIRALGRKGVLEMNAVAGMSQLAQIKDEMKNVLGFVDFNQGHQYADFNPGLDKVAVFGIGALIAGKVALKVGLFKGLLVFLLAAKKALIAGGIALAAVIRGFLNKRKQAATVPAPAAAAAVDDET